MLIKFLAKCLSSQSKVLSFKISPPPLKRFYGSVKKLIIEILAGNGHQYTIFLFKNNFNLTERSSLKNTYTKYFRMRKFSHRCFWGIFSQRHGTSVNFQALNFKRNIIHTCINVLKKHCYKAKKQQSTYNNFDFSVVFLS